MPLIYGTDELQEMHRKLLEKHPSTDVIILVNSVMAYAFNSSARAVYRVGWPDQRPLNRINFARSSVPSITDKLIARGLSVGVCDLDDEPPALP